MATYTANHLYVTTLVNCTAGPWLGEQAVWGLRFCVGRTALDAGEFTLNTFDVSTDTKARALTLESVPGQLVSPWAGEALPATENVEDNHIDDILAAVFKFWVTTKTYLPNVWKLAHMKMYPTGVDGKAPAGPLVWTPDTPVAGINSSNFRSPETALCVSLYSADRSKHGRGRIFIGPTVAMEQADGTVSVGTTAGISNNMAVCQSEIREIGTAGASATYNGIIWNRTTKSKASTINRVRVGDEQDHQERRTKSRPEVYANTAVT
jgi:hypothetical protein